MYEKLVIFPPYEHLYQAMIHVHVVRESMSENVILLAYALGWVHLASGHNLIVSLGIGTTLSLTFRCALIKYQINVQ